MPPLSGQRPQSGAGAQGVLSPHYTRFEGHKSRNSSGWLLQPPALAAAGPTAPLPILSSTWGPRTPSLNFDPVVASPAPPTPPCPQPKSTSLPEPRGPARLLKPGLLSLQSHQKPEASRKPLILSRLFPVSGILSLSVPQFHLL